MDFKTSHPSWPFRWERLRHWWERLPPELIRALGMEIGNLWKTLDDWQGFAPNTNSFLFFWGGGVRGRESKNKLGVFFSGFLVFVFLCKKTSLYLILGRFPIFWTPLQPVFFLYLESIVFLSSHGIDQLFMVGILSEIRILCLHFQGTGWRAISKRFQMWLGRWKR